MKRVIAALLMACCLITASSAPAAASVPFIEPAQAQWDIFLQVLKTILTLRLDEGIPGTSPGLKVLVGEVYRFLDQGFPDPFQFSLLARLRQTFNGLASLRNEVTQLACAWNFSKRTLTLRKLYLEPINLCKGDTDLIWGDIPRGLPNADLQDMVGYVATSSQNLASSHIDSSLDWSQHFGSMYHRSSDVRTSPGEAIRDGVHTQAAKVAVDASNGQILAQDLLVRQTEDTFDRAEEKAASFLSASIYSDLAGVPLRFVQAPPYTPPPDPTPAPSGGGGGGNGDGDGGGDCNRTRPNFLGEVQAAISRTTQRHPEWLSDQGSDGQVHAGPQVYVAQESWDQYYGDVVANLKASGLQARVDPCMCGEIQVKHDESLSDQYHILTSWGQVRTDQNAYRDTCVPPAF